MTRYTRVLRRWFPAARLWYSEDGLPYAEIGEVSVAVLFLGGLPSALLVRHGDACEMCCNVRPDLGPAWRIEQDGPLTLSPSVACDLCGHHGWIRDGRWEDV